jgi:hypothetical protein
MSTKQTAGAAGPGSLDLRVISASDCAGGSCPTIYDSGRGTIVVQGYTVVAERSGVALPDGEQLVEIPIELLTSAARTIS